MSVLEEIRIFLTRVGGNVQSTTAYDTAWVAALGTADNPGAAPTPLFPESLEWLLTHQHPDGSWGTTWPYYHDRLLATLRAVLTLNSWGDQCADTLQVERGLRYLWQHAERLDQDPAETAGFELIFPTLLAQAERQGLALPAAAFAGVQRLREEKLRKAPLHLASDRSMPLVVNLEGLGIRVSCEQAGALQDDIGAVGMSPAATAFLLQQCPGNQAARTYLRRALQAGTGDGGAPTYFPLETFERGWTLYALQYARPDICTVLAEATDPLLEFLVATRTPAGWATSRHHGIKESDSTGLCFTVLSRAGREQDPQLLYQYEEADYFRCFPFERNPSISANVHVLDALHYCDPGERAGAVDKVIRFLRATRGPGGFWLDKWHVSPHYTSSHVVLAAHDFAPDLVEPAVRWMLHTQRTNGSWGYYAPTLEETANTLLALLVWRDAGHPVEDSVLARGADYLRQHFAPESRDYPPLWIGKALYAPIQVIQGAILAALLAYETRM